MDKIDRDGENKRQRLCRCCSNYALWKLIVDNGLEDLRRRENPQIPPSSPVAIGPFPRSRIDRVYTDIYTDIKIANNTKINHIMVSFTDHYNAISIDRLPLKTKIGKDSWYFNNSLLCKPEVSSATRLFFLLKIEKKKNNCSRSGHPAFKSWSCRLRFS